MDDSGVILGARHLPLAELKARAGRAAGALAGLGLGAGDVLAVAMRTDVAALEAMLAAPRIGAAAPVLNPGLEPAELAGLIAGVGARAVLAHPALLAVLAGRLPPAVRLLAARPSPEVAAAWGLADAALPEGALDWDRMAAEGAAWDGPPAPPVALSFTSGSTGRPKALRRGAQDPATIDLARRNGARLFAFRPGQRTVLPGPLHHSTPNGYALATLHLEGLLVLMPRFDAAALLALIGRHRITHLPVAPSHLAALAKLPAAVRAAHDLGSLEAALLGGGPCPPAVKQAVARWWGPALREFYGSTELGPITLAENADLAAHPGSVGRPLDGVRLAVLDAAGRPCSPGVTGEVHALASFVPEFAYIPGMGERQEREGLVATGDMGWLEPDGRLVLRDRRAHVIEGAAGPIWPAESEALLWSHPDIADCACLPLPDAEPPLRALAVPAAGAGAAPRPDDLRAWMAERLPASQVPARIDLVPALPRDDSGKLPKRRLNGLVEALS